MSKTAFNWQDPFSFQALLTDEERMIQQAAHDYCQDRLMSRVLLANRHEHFDVEIMRRTGGAWFIRRHATRKNTAVPASTTSVMAWSRAKWSALTAVIAARCRCSRAW